MNPFLTFYWLVCGYALLVLLVGRLDMTYGQEAVTTWVASAFVSGATVAYVTGSLGLGFAETGVFFLLVLAGWSEYLTKAIYIHAAMIGTKALWALLAWLA